jgi:predicted nucleic acid-binding protein
MKFTDLPAGERIFLDANVFVYHFTQHPQFGAACTDLISRIERQEILVFSATHVLTEVAHRLMTLEAAALMGWPFAGIMRRLKRHPEVVRQLVHFRRAVERVGTSRIQILSIPPVLIPAGTICSQQTGLLSSDALIFAVMQHNGLTNLASLDDDFDRVPGLTRYGSA